MVAIFELGNTDSVRKRISVILRDAYFSDLQVCTLWLPPNSPIHEYYMVANPTKDWRNATVSFYAATVGVGGAYQIDNVRMFTNGAISDQATSCIDTAIGAPGGTLGANLVANGSFTAGGTSWTSFGQIDGIFTGVDYRFTRLPGSPPGGLFQSTGQPIAAGQMVQVDFQLGLFAGTRGRVTVIVHDASFGDLAACSFWLDPKAPKRQFTMTLHATQAWTDATISIYPATTLPGLVFQLDEVQLRPVTGGPGAGTACLAGAPVAGP